MIHATKAELAAYLAVAEAALPADADRLLARASELIDTHAFGYYVVDSVTSRAVDTHVLVGLRDATCAQIEWWMQTGDEVEATSRFAYPGIGSLNVRTSGRRLAPRAQDALRRAGLAEGAAV